MFGLAYSGGWLLKKAERLRPDAERQTLITYLLFYLKNCFCFTRQASGVKR